MTSTVTSRPAALARLQVLERRRGADVVDVQRCLLVRGDLEGAGDIEALAERRDAAEAEPRRGGAFVHLPAREERVVLGVDGDRCAP